VESIQHYAPLFLQGLGVTAAISGLSIVGAAVVAIGLGAVRASSRGPAVLSSIVVIELLRGAPVVIYLFWLFFALPAIPGAPQLPSALAAVLVLSFSQGAYGSEIIRAGLQAVHSGQRDASLALGLGPAVRFTRVVLPQALSQVVPAFGSLSVDIVKMTSIVSFIGVQDIFYAANTARSATGDTMASYLVLMLGYVVLCLIVAAFFRAIEYFLPVRRAQRAAHERRFPLRTKVMSTR